MNSKCPYVKISRNSNGVFTGDVTLPHSMWGGRLGTTYHEVIDIVLQNLNYKNPTGNPIEKVQISCEDGSIDEQHISRVRKVLQRKKSDIKFYQL